MTDNEMPDLFPCPFCGGDAFTLGDYDGRADHRCYPEGPFYADTAGGFSVQEWNTRADLNKTAWQPIETAPMDGTEIMVLNTNDKNCGYCTEPGQIGIAYWGKSLGKGSWCSTVCCDGVSNFKPTHWMPLPAPPNTLIGGE